MASVASPTLAHLDKCTTSPKSHSPRHLTSTPHLYLYREPQAAVESELTLRGAFAVFSYLCEQRRCEDGYINYRSEA